MAPVDPHVAALIGEIYGPDAVRALAKSMPDGSATSAPGTITPGQQRKRKAIVGGLLLGTVAEGSAVAHAARDLAKPGGSRAVKGAHLALQAVNAGVGLAAARELVKKPKTPSASVVSKAKMVPIPHAQPAAIVHANARAGRIGLRLVTGAVSGASAAGGYAAGRHTRQRTAAPAPVTGEVGKSVGLEWRGTFSKMDPDKRQVFGWANLAVVDGQPVIDLQGDYVAIEEIEKSAYAYMLNSRVGGHMHQRIGKGLDLGPVHVADVIESFVVTPEKLAVMGLDPDALPLGWWTGMQVNDESVWQQVKRGDLAGFSIHGSGVRRELVSA